MAKSKLIIHETDCHGCGRIYFEGRTENYSYDDGDLGDVRATVEGLIELGFIDPNDVIIFDDYEKNIYKFIEKALTD
jgi:hypothetical protein